MNDRILSKRETCEMVNMSNVTLWRKMNAGEFPKAVQLGPNRMGWRLSTVQKWIAELPEVDGPCNTNLVGFQNKQRAGNSA